MIRNQTLPLRRGFTLVETLAVIAVVGALAGILMPAARASRTTSRGAASQANLMQIGIGSAMYALDNEGRIHTYTWSAPRSLSESPSVFVLPNGQQKTVRFGSGDQEAVAWQNVAILMEETGRLDGPDKIRSFSGRMANRRFTHLPLVSYLGIGVDSPLFVDPDDANLLTWQADPLNYGVGSTVPYAIGDPGPGFDSDGFWRTVNQKQRWAFGSSYHPVIAAWNTDGRGGAATFGPVYQTQNLVTGQAGADGSRNVFVSDGRFYDQVRFPSAKVHYHEEFDRSQTGEPYFAYDHARADKLMFDGSVNDWASGDARSSAHPLSTMIRDEWTQPYIPLDTFPVPLGGLGDMTELNQRYRWTRFGLHGIDYAVGDAGGAAVRNGP